MPSRPEAVSIVIPSWTGETARVRESIQQQTYKDYRVYIVQGISPAGRARNIGARASRGAMILFIDDDAFLGHERVVETLVATIESDRSVGIVGPSKLIPTSATALQRRIAAEVPRWVYPVVDENEESNPPIDHHGYTGITTTCCLMSRTVFDQLNGFDERLPTGPEDTEFFYRARRAGHRFIIPAHSWVYHDPPRTIQALLRKSFHYGIGHALEARLWPERNMAIVPLDRWYGKLFLLLSPILVLPSIFINVYFDPVRSIIVGFRPLKAISTYATFCGYAWGWFVGPR